MMSSPTSSVLLYSPPQNKSYAFGADNLSNLEDLKTVSPQKPYPVIVYFDRGQSADAITLELESIRQLCPKTHILLITSKKDSRWLMELKNKGLLHSLLHSDQEPALSLQIQSLLADHAEFEQNELVLNLYHEQNLKLEKLNQELEERVQKRQKYLLKSQKQLKNHREKISLLHQGLLSIFRGDSVAKIENFLFDVLKEPLLLEWLRIRFSDQSLLTSHSRETENSSEQLLELPLLFEGISSGRLLLKKKTKTFSDDEKELLSQLSETLSLAIGRIVKRQDAESLKQQWESTFDAISAPLCLTDDKLQVLRTNRSFSEEAGLPINRILGKQALPALFGPETKVLEQRLLESPQGKIEVVKSKGTEEKYFEVSLHSIGSIEEDESVFMILFKDITEQRRMETQLLETSKMAELGIIGSSIAHELNNPIAGMTSFLQLILMDLRPEDPVWEDVKEMETAAKRCKDIIENLLGFARKQESEEASVDLHEVLQQAVSISELQTRAKGLTVELPKKVNPILIKGNFNQLTQAFQNLLKNALEACLEKSESEPRFKAKIECKIVENDQEISVLISDNGPGIPKEIQSKIFNPLFTTKASGLAPGLGLTVAFKIITEHKAKLEIASRLGRGTTARISFQRPDL